MIVMIETKGRPFYEGKIVACSLWSTTWLPGLGLMWWILILERLRRWFSCCCHAICHRRLSLATWQLKWSSSGTIMLRISATRWTSTCTFSSNWNEQECKLMTWCFFYQAIICPVAEYACPVWHSGLTVDQSDRIESIRCLAMKLSLMTACTLMCCKLPICLS